MADAARKQREGDVAAHFGRRLSPSAPPCIRPFFGCEIARIPVFPLPFLGVGVSASHVCGQFFFREWIYIELISASSSFSCQPRVTGFPIPLYRARARALGCQPSQFRGDRKIWELNREIGATYPVSHAHGLFLGVVFVVFGSNARIAKALDKSQGSGNERRTQS